MPVGFHVDREWFPPHEHPTIQHIVAISFPSGLVILIILLTMWYLDPSQFPQKILPIILLSFLFFISIIIVGVILTMMFTSPGKFSPKIQYLVAISFLLASTLNGFLLATWEMRLLRFL